MEAKAKIRVAHLSGPNATIQNTPPLVTSNKARTKHGLAPMREADGSDAKFDALRAQRLAAPVKVYVEQFSAHPLERDAAELYGPPDGYLDADGVFHKERRSERDKPVYEIELKPEDGLYPLPYMARQADGRPWEEECTDPFAPAERARQGFFPDGSRSFEEIDRLSVNMNGVANSVSAQAEVDFYRLLPPAGFTKGQSAALRSDVGEGDIAPERRGRDFFPYKPYHLGAGPPRPTLARITNIAQSVMSSGKYDGAIFTQGSPAVEETAYWFNLLIDTSLPMCGNAAQRPHGQISNDGPQNIVDSLAFIRSRIWADEAGKSRTGVIVLQEQRFFAAREVAKLDARPGGYGATGGHGGILGGVNHMGHLALLYLPAYRHTHLSEVNTSRLPEASEAVRAGRHGPERFSVAIKGKNGEILADAIPSVSIVKEGNYFAEEFGDDPAEQRDLLYLIDQKLALGRLAGFVTEGQVPYGRLPSSLRQRVMERAVYSGLPVVGVGRGNTEGFADRHPIFIAGSNLTATKARLLLMACLMRLGALPPARDPARPTAAERSAIEAAVARYQAIFDTH
ncbi:MAG TPA: asparaginase domain-containing protein [Stellaceae bacterium]|nr:asparaginase domain-containing protein [Stellaceae bacterium]